MDKTSVPGIPIEPKSGLDERFREVMDAAPVMIWVSDTNKLCVWFNRPWLEYTGRTMAEEFGNGWAEGVHPDDFDDCLRIYTSCFDARAPFQMQYRLRRHDGAYRWIDDTGIPRYARDGTFLGYIGSCVDVHASKVAEEQLQTLKQALELRIVEKTVELETEVARRGVVEAKIEADVTAQKHTEAALATSEHLFRLLVQGVVDYAIYMLDPKGVITSWNPGAQRIKGYSAGEVIGRNYAMFYTEDSRAAGLPAKNLEIATRDGKYAGEGWRVRKDGTRFWANVVLDPIRDETGELVGFAKITRDMSEQRAMQEQLNKAREELFQTQKLEALGQLTGGVAHDFNNLLTIILGNIDTAQRRIDTGTSPEQLKRFLTNAQTGARRAATLTQRLLAFARRQPLDPKTLNVNKFLTTMGEFLQRTLGEQIDVETVGGAGVWQIEADAAQLESTLLNLALNARDAMPNGGKLTLESSNTYLDADYCRSNPEVSAGQYVLISVSDTGTGMTPETMTRAFEPFFTTKTMGQGTGLGLSQVYGFVKQSGGHVKVYSEVGEGTTVKIYLKRHFGEGQSADASQNEMPGAQDGETILVVEDDHAVLDYITEVLSDLKYYVLRASDGQAALRYINDRARRIDLLLTDVVMPGMSGRALAEQAARARPGIKVLFMTGYSQNAIVHQGRLDRGVQLIQKPLSQDQLAERVRDLLG